MEIRVLDKNENIILIYSSSVLPRSGEIICFTGGLGMIARTEQNTTSFEVKNVAHVISDEHQHVVIEVEPIF